MDQLEPYRRRSDTRVAAVQLALETEGFVYEKWGGVQRATSGDWLVDNGEDVYTVERETFERTYRKVSQGVYEKVGTVWARVATEAGAVRTKEGETHYEAGDVIVHNDPEGGDGYAMTADEFARLYEKA